MNILDACVSRRSMRRFTRQAVPRDALAAIAEAGRLSPTHTNRQPLHFAVVEAPALCGRIFPHTRWAKKIPDGSAGPDELTQPAVYIALLVDRTITTNADIEAGAAAMAMMLAAEVQGIASCWLANIDRKEILDLLDMDAERFILHSIIALGYPAMRVRTVPVVDGKTDYYLEDVDSLCVPKRAAEDVIHWKG